MDTDFEKRLGGKKTSGINYSQISPQKRNIVMSPVTSVREGVKSTRIMGWGGGSTSLQWAKR